MVLYNIYKVYKFTYKIQVNLIHVYTLCYLQGTVVTAITAECVARYRQPDNVLLRQFQSSGSFYVTKSQWSALFGGEKCDPSWVHAMAEGLSVLNSCCCFAFKRHWIKKAGSRKNTTTLFTANARCTFETCNIVADLSVNTNSFQDDEIAVHVNFNGQIHHDTEETHARHFSHSARCDMCERFLDTNVAPAKEYHHRLMQLGPDKYAL